MMRHIKAFLIVSFALAACSAGSKDADPFNYTIKIKNFTNLIFTQKETSWALNSDNEKFVLPATPFQKTEGSGRNVKITSGDFSSAANETAAENFTEDTMLLSINSEPVKKLAEQIASQGNIARNTEKFVYNYITNKANGLPLTPSLNIIETRSGDCKQHTVLTVALLRSMGIPARALIGMIATSYFKRQENVFVFHMWAEAYYNGRWILIDATRPEDIHPNRYIAFAYHNLRTMTPLSYIKAVSGIQNMSAEYIGGKP